MVQETEANRTQTTPVGPARSGNQVLQWRRHRYIAGGFLLGVAASVLGAWTAAAFAPIQTERLEIVDDRGNVLMRLQAGKTGSGELEFFDRRGKSIGFLPAAAKTPTTRAPARPAAPVAVPGGTYAGAGGGHWVRKKMDSGNMIQLEDGSLWQISPIDRINTMLWLTTENITVIESNSMPGYPYKLVNEDSGNTAAAKLLK